MQPHSWRRTGWAEAAGQHPWCHGTGRGTRACCSGGVAAAACQQPDLLPPYHRLPADFIANDANSTIQGGAGRRTRLIRTAFLPHLCLGGQQKHDSQQRGLHGVQVLGNPRGDRVVWPQVPRILGWQRHSTACHLSSSAEACACMHPSMASTPLPHSFGFCAGYSSLCQQCSRQASNRGNERKLQHTGQVTSPTGGQHKGMHQHCAAAARQLEPTAAWQRR